MCGIFGLIGSADAELGERLAECLRHRGPDDHGVRAHPPPPPRAHSPIPPAPGRTVIAYNGEVFTFADVRAELLKRGHTFRSNSDTEVIANAYEAWGDECVHRCRGLFAFLLWDIPR